MHYFLIASLPLLEIGETAPMTVAEFDELLKETVNKYKNYFILNTFKHLLTPY